MSKEEDKVKEVVKIEDNNNNNNNNMTTKKIICVNTINKNFIPLLFSATVVKGFGRGSKMLGIPTANMDMKELGDKVDKIETGIWFGWAFLRGIPYKTVVSIGWNPFFDNKMKTIEPYLIHDFGEEDFYDENLKVLMCGYLRPEANFTSLEALIEAIHKDIEDAKVKLDEEEFAKYEKIDVSWQTMD